jgi:membrane associated rhomboid family serine protease
MPIESPEIETLTPANTDFSDVSANASAAANRPSARLIVAIAAATSALLGGLAAAWYYRRTISRLQQAEQNGPDSKFGISEPTDDDGR